MIQHVNITEFKGILQYKDFLVYNLRLNNKIACNAYVNLKTNLYFNDYYNESIIKILFDRYLNMVLVTFNFIYTF